MFISKKKFETKLDEKWQEGWIAGRKRGQESVRYDGIIIKQLLGEFSHIITMILSSSEFRKKEERQNAAIEIADKIKQIVKAIDERIVI